MPSTIGVKNHHVVDKDIVTAIDLFFGERNWKGLYLTGGTCLAEFYFGHRLSVDMDLFTHDRELFMAARRILARNELFPFGNVVSVRTLPDFCEFLLVRKNKDPIKIDVVFDIPVSLQKKLSCGPVWLDSLPDLLANKLGCVIQRNEVKDYLDLFYLLPAADLAIAELIALGQKKDAGLDPLALAHQIQYIQSIDHAPQIFLANVPWKQIQGFFSRLHNDILDYLASL